MEIKESLDTSFGDGPTQPQIEKHLVAGRRALRRRRVTTSVAALAVVSLVGGTSWLATGGTDNEPDNGADRIATQPSASSTVHKGRATKEKVPTPPKKSDFLGEPALLKNGHVFLADGWQEVSVIDNPMGYQAPNRSMGLEVRKGEEHKFVLVCEFVNGTSTNSGAAVGTLADWLETAVANQHTLDVENQVVPPDKVNGPLVTMDEGGTLIARSDLRIVQQVAGLDFGPRFAGPNDPTAAARLDMPTGKDVYVVVRRIAGSKTEVIRGGNAGTFPTLDAFLAHAKTQYAGKTSEGLR
ncbi:hypothetical protein ASG90_00120 [Nocardioides sp. Soil797]|nr:hypothetical protein ASG90_00120 [Nocardioides sp. Soil797]